MLEHDFERVTIFDPERRAHTNIGDDLHLRRRIVVDLGDDNRAFDAAGDSDRLATSVAIMWTIARVDDANAGRAFDADPERHRVRIVNDHVDCAGIWIDTEPVNELRTCPIELGKMPALTDTGCEPAQESFGAHAARTEISMWPILSAQQCITSPGWTGPTPSGVPVIITSPGYSV